MTGSRRIAYDLIMVFLHRKQLTGIIQIVQIQINRRSGWFFEVGVIFPLFTLQFVTVGGTPIVLSNFAFWMLFNKSCLNHMVPASRNIPLALPAQTG